MKEKINNLILNLKEVSDVYHNDGDTIRKGDRELSEFYYGVSEGIDYAIEKLELLVK